VRIPISNNTHSLQEHMSPRGAINQSGLFNHKYFKEVLLTQLIRMFIFEL